MKTQITDSSSTETIFALVLKGLEDEINTFANRYAEQIIEEFKSDLHNNIRRIVAEKSLTMQGYVSVERLGSTVRIEIMDRSKEQNS